MTSTTPNPSNVTPVNPLAVLLPAETSADADEATVTDPTCPKCGSDLEVSRIYKGRDLYSAATVTLYQREDGTWTADVEMGDDAKADEVMDVLDEQVQCRSYGSRCDFTIPADQTGTVSWA